MKLNRIIQNIQPYKNDTIQNQMNMKECDMNIQECDKNMKECDIYHIFFKYHHQHHSSRFLTSYFYDPSQDNVNKLLLESQYRPIIFRAFGVGQDTNKNFQRQKLELKMQTNTSHAPYIRVYIYIYIYIYGE